MTNKFMVSMADLKKAVLFNRSVTSGMSVGDDNKNIIFSAKNGLITASAYVVGIAGSLDIEPQEYEVEDEWNFQLRSSSIMHLLKSYSSLTYTRVSGITFQEAKASVQIIVHEEVKNEDDDPRFAQDGQFRIGVAPTTDKVLKAVSKEFDAEAAEDVSSVEVDLYIRDLLRLVNNDKSAGAKSQINVGEEYAFVNSGTSFSAYLHTLPEQFFNISLSYPQALSLLTLNDGATGKQIDEEVSSDEEYQELEESGFGFDEDEETSSSEEDPGIEGPSIKVNRDSKNVISFEYENTRLFLTVSPVKIRYKKYFDPVFEKDEKGDYINRDIWISVDRLYLKNVLKRLSFDADSVSFTCEDGMLAAKTASMTHGIPIVDSSGDDSSVSFKLLPSALERMIIGNDSDYSGVEGGEEVLLVFTPTDRGFQLHILDGLDTWVSAANIQKA